MWAPLWVGGCTGDAPSASERLPEILLAVPLSGAHEGRGEAAVRAAHAAADGRATLVVRDAAGLSAADLAELPPPGSAMVGAVAHIDGALLERLAPAWRELPMPVVSAATGDMPPGLAAVTQSPTQHRACVLAHLLETPVTIAHDAGVGTTAALRAIQADQIPGIRLEPVDGSTLPHDAGRITRGKPRRIAWMGTPELGGDLVRLLRRSGDTTPVLAIDGHNPGFLSRAGADDPDLMVTSARRPPGEGALPWSIEGISSADQTGATDVYAAVRLILAAVDQAGSAGPAAARDALPQTKTHDLAGELALAADLRPALGWCSRHRLGAEGLVLDARAPWPPAAAPAAGALQTED